MGLRLALKNWLLAPSQPFPASPALLFRYRLSSSGEQRAPRLVRIGLVERDHHAYVERGFRLRERGCAIRLPKQSRMPAVASNEVAEYCGAQRILHAGRGLERLRIGENLFGGRDHRGRVTVAYRAYQREPLLLVHRASRKALRFGDPCPHRSSSLGVD